MKYPMKASGKEKLKMVRLGDMGIDGATFLKTQRSMLDLSLAKMSLRYLAKAHYA